MRPIDTKLETELKRGIFQIAVLHLLQEPLYGYQIGRMLAARGLSVEEGTLYPLLRRLEEQELLESWWVTEQARPRKYYRTTGEGRESLLVLVGVWERVHGSLRRILEAAPGAGPPQQGGGDAGAAGGTEPPPEGAGADDA